MTAPPAPTRPLPLDARGVDLDVVLASRLRRGLAGTVLAGRTATVVFDAGEAGVWTVTLDGGRGHVRRGSA
jgi:hypothetical protein